jgi:phosphoribosylamine---glycine ligase
MGAYSPAPILTGKLRKTIATRIIEPAIRGMQRNGTPFKGVLYAGLMMTSEGPMVLEFNVRFGDPEAQAVLPRMKGDIVELMLASCEGRLDTFESEWDKRSCICVVISSGGYPGEYETGKEITGLEDAGKNEDMFVFHAGTKKEGDKIVTSGGRVLGVTSLGNTIEGAIDRVYKAVDKIHFERCFFRRDIGSKAFKWIRHRSQVVR